MTRIPPLLRAALELRAETDLSRLFLPAQEGETQNTAMNDISKTARAVMLAAANGNLNVVDDPVYKQCIAAAIRTAAEELQYTLFLPGNDARVVDSKSLFELASELENIQ